MQIVRTVQGKALGLVVTLLILAATRAPAAPAGGFFIPRNGGYEGRIGKAHLYIDSAAGGAIQVVDGEWPQLQSLGRVVMTFQVTTKGSPDPVAVSQEFDRSPEVIFIEEGNQRLGVRVKCRLYDKANVYHGHGMTEVWAYPNGEVFVACAISFENMAPVYATNSVTVNVANTRKSLMR